MKGNEIRTVCCYGAGTIGAGFAIYFSWKGCEVRVYDIDVPRAEQALKTPLAAMMKLGIITDADDIMSRITVTDDPAKAMTDVQFIQESAFENIPAKIQFIKTMEQYCPTDCIIASSSSGLSLSDMIVEAEHPERIIVAHPFNPSYLIPLMEICTCEKTSKEVVQTAVDFYKSVDKEPVVMLKEAKGYIANRLAHALWREEISMVCEGICTLDDAEKAIFYGPGMRWAIFGPAMSYELSGGELGLRGCAIKFGETTNQVFETLSNMSRVPDNWPDLADEGIKEVMANYPDFIGHTREEIAEYRDRVLVEELRLHHKI